MTADGPPADDRAAIPPVGRLTSGDIELDADARQARVGGRPVPLRRREFDLLYTLMSHAGELLGHEMLLDTVWGDTVDPATTKTLKAHIARVRTHLVTAGASATCIRTVRGSGYTFGPPTLSPRPESRAIAHPPAVIAVGNAAPVRLLTVSGVQLNLDGIQLRSGAARVELTTTEFRLLLVLMERAGHVVSQEQIATAVWGSGRAGELAECLRRVRQRLEQVGASPTLIRTVRGMGYVFDVVTPTAPAG